MKRLSRRFAHTGAAGAFALAVLSGTLPGWAANETEPKTPAVAEPAVAEPAVAAPAVAEPAAATPAAAAPAVSAAPATPGPAPAPAASARDSYDGPPVLLGNGRKFKVGGYGAVGGAYTRMIGRDSGLMSIEAALLLDHRLSIGAVGYGFTRTPRGPDATDGARQQFGAGYGGLALRYSLFAAGSPVYGTFGVVLGGGAVNLHRDDGWDEEIHWDDENGWDDDFDDDRDWNAGKFDAFLFAQPEISLNANATRWLRFGATVGYRFTGGVSRFGLSESDLNGVVVGANIGLGWF